MKKWLAFGSLLGASSLVVYNLNFKSKGKTQTLTILSEKKMIEVLERIKIEYRTQFFMFQKHFLLKSYDSFILVFLFLFVSFNNSCHHALYFCTAFLIPLINQQALLKPKFSNQIKTPLL